METGRYIPLRRGTPRRWHDIVPVRLTLAAVVIVVALIVLVLICRHT
jgi:hypothetical protein